MPKSTSIPQPEEGVSRVRIRRGSLADAAAMQALARCSPGASQWPAEVYERMFAPGAPLRPTWVAEVCAPHRVCGSGKPEREPAGFLVAFGGSADWELENLAVAQAYRRRGLGRRLVRALLVAARRRGAESIFLEVRESNRTARTLYEAAGFRAAGRRALYYADPPEDAIVYRRQLAPRKLR
jgi:ribosomal-protein-alanine N-acetyltransferase